MQKKYHVVKKVGQSGDKVKKHNHPEANVIVTIVKGNLDVYINDELVGNLTPGSILHFDGNDYVHFEFVEDSEFFVTLIKKEF